jgi:hypothetical protein
MEKLIYNATLDSLKTVSHTPVGHGPSWRQVECKNDVWKIVINGRVVDESLPAHYYGDTGSGVKYFFEHLRNALTHPDTFVFDGYIGKEGSVGWLEHHRARLHLSNWNNSLFLVNNKNKIESIIVRQGPKVTLADTLKLVEAALKSSLEKLNELRDSSNGEARALCKDALQAINRTGKLP